MKCISIWPIVGVSEVVFALYLILAVQYVLVPCGIVMTGKCGTATEKREERFHSNKLELQQKLSHPYFEQVKIEWTLLPRKQN